MPRTRRGFSLVETIVAIALLGAALVAIQSATPLLIRTLAESDRAELAASIAATRSALATSECRDASARDSAPGIAVDWSATTSLTTTGTRTIAVLRSATHTARSPHPPASFRSLRPCP